MRAISLEEFNANCEKLMLALEETGESFVVKSEGNRFLVERIPDKQREDMMRELNPNELG